MNRHHPTLIRTVFSCSGLLALSSPFIFAADATPAVNMAANGNPPAVETPATPATAAPINPALTNPFATPVLPGDPRLSLVGRSDANGNPIRMNKITGHLSNYDESKVPPYTLPDPLVLANGQPVKDADTWFKVRRPEILKLYQTEIYGRIPATAPKVTWQETIPPTSALNGAAMMKQITGTLGDGADAPKVNVVIYTPANATGPVPLVLAMNFNFGGGGAPRGARGGAPRGAAAAANPATANVNGQVAPMAAAPARGARGAGAAPGGDPIGEVIAHGYGYARVYYTEFEHDAANDNVSLVRKLALAPGQDKPAADEWGTISAWAWGASRIMDYLQTDKSVDGRRVAIFGHSRLGKTALWVGAQDERFSMVFSSCGGELGSALARRDFGETVDDMAQNFSWQFAGNLQKYVGQWKDLPVDTHFLISLIAPRPVFISGGSTDQWSDAHGEFLGEVAAGPVYKLVGKTDLGTSELPALDTPLTSGDMGFVEHTGGHATPLPDWQAFLNFADKYWKDKK